MSAKRTLHTERLRLEPLGHRHAEAMAPVIGDERIASVTSNIPYPYTLDDAHAFADRVANPANRDHVWALIRQDNGQLVGGCGLVFNEAYTEAELGYWIGVESWGQGFATEGARAIVEHGFEISTLKRIHACFFLRNPASGRVLVKLGMTPCEAGSCAECVTKNGVEEPIERLELLRDG